MDKSVHCTQNTYFFPQLRHIVSAWFLVYGSEQCQDSCADPDITNKYFLPGTPHEPDLAADADPCLCGLSHDRAWKRKELKGSWSNANWWQFSHDPDIINGHHPTSGQCWLGMVGLPHRNAPWWVLSWKTKLDPTRDDKLWEWALAKSCFRAVGPMCSK